MNGVAVVGIACRFPGAADKDAFWDMVLRKDHGMTEIPKARWSAREYYSPDGRPGTLNTRTGGFVSDVDSFDNRFFALSESDAAAMDPQQRMLLQCSWHAVEDAGLDPRALASTVTGVYVGVTANDWLWKTAATAEPDELAPPHGAGSGHNMTANRISYQYNLRGPSVAVDTACSSSLVAVHLAASALRMGECDYALAGGANAVLEPVNGMYFTMLGLSAPDGRCKPFNADADGMGRGEGVGLVVLRRLADAIADGQRVYAVIEGSAVTHSGRSNGITAPARRGQQDAIEFAYRQAGISPEDVDFVEAHGTGTVIGDLIEAKALGAVHAVPRDQPCAIGSVKGNIGHTEGAAGVASLIKAALSLYHHTVPASINGVPENPDLRLAEHGLRLLHEPLALRNSGARGAVSAFGIGGTNAHVVLADAPAPERADEHGLGVFTLSAADSHSLRHNLIRQAEYLTGTPHDLAALCHASNRVKSSLKRRFAFAAESPVHLIDELRAAATHDDVLAVRSNREGRMRVALVFGESVDLDPEFLLSPVFRVLREEFDEAIGGPVAESVLRHPHPEGPAEVTFVAQYLLAAAVRALGVRPVALVGRGAGNLVATHLAGGRNLTESLRMSFSDRFPVEVSVTGQAERLTHVIGIGARPDVDLNGEPLTLGSLDSLRRLAIESYLRGGDPRWTVFGGDRNPVARLAPYRFADTRFPLTFSALAGRH